jgi:hypothetical protein
MGGGRNPWEDVYCVGCEGVDCKWCKTALLAEGRTVGRCISVQYCPYDGNGRRNGKSTSRSYKEWSGKEGQKSSVHEIVSATQKNNFRRRDMSARRTKCTGRGSMAEVSIRYISAVSITGPGVMALLYEYPRAN